MNLIIPMAGRGTRLRPATLITPKPLFPIAGEPMVVRLLETLHWALPGVKFKTIGFVVNGLSESERAYLAQAAKRLGAAVSFYEQPEPLGTAHAIHCAAEMLTGPVLVAFADTLFRTHMSLDLPCDGVVWTKRVSNPSAFGVIQCDDHEKITAFVEKPVTFVSDQAIIGVYYFKQAEWLSEAIRYLFDHAIRSGQEYQLTHALTYMVEQGAIFHAQEVEEWWDCGNKEALLYAHQRYLTQLDAMRPMLDPTATVRHSVLIPPVYIGPEAIIEGSVIGPYVSIERHSRVIDARVQNSVIQAYSIIESARLNNSMVGTNACFRGNVAEINLGDYSKA